MQSRRYAAFSCESEGGSLTTLAFWILFGSSLASLWTIWRFFGCAFEAIERIVGRRLS